MEMPAFPQVKGRAGVRGTGVAASPPKARRGDPSSVSAAYLQLGAGGLLSCSRLGDPTRGAGSQPAEAFASPALGQSVGGKGIALPNHIAASPVLVSWTTPAFLTPALCSGCQTALLGGRRWMEPTGAQRWAPNIPPAPTTLALGFLRALSDPNKVVQVLMTPWPYSSGKHGRQGCLDTEQTWLLVGPGKPSDPCCCLG